MIEIKKTETVSVTATDSESEESVYQAYDSRRVAIDDGKGTAIVWATRERARRAHAAAGEVNISEEDDPLCQWPDEAQDEEDESLAPSPEPAIAVLAGIKGGVGLRGRDGETVKPPRLEQEPRRRRCVDATNPGDDEPDEYRAHCKAKRAEVEAWPAEKRAAAEAAFAPKVDDADDLPAPEAQHWNTWEFPEWDAEAIEATLRKAAAEGLRVRIAYPEDWDDRGSAVGVPKRSGAGNWLIDPWFFRVGQSESMMPGITAAEIIDGDADTESEAVS